MVKTTKCRVDAQSVTRIRWLKMLYCFRFGNIAARRGIDSSFHLVSVSHHAERAVRDSLANLFTSLVTPCCRLSSRSRHETLEPLGPCELPTQATDVALQLCGRHPPASFLPSPEAWACKCDTNAWSVSLLLRFPSSPKYVARKAKSCSCAPITDSARMGRIYVFLSSAVVSALPSP